MSLATLIDLAFMLYCCPMAAWTAWKRIWPQDREECLMVLVIIVAAMMQTLSGLVS